MFTTTHEGRLRRLFAATVLAGMLAAGLVAAGHVGGGHPTNAAVAVNTGHAADELQQEMAN
jgi:hypothetical protein